MRDFDRLLRESQREVLRLQRQIALRNQQEPPPPPRPPGPAAPARAGAPAPGAPGEVSSGAGTGVWASMMGCGTLWELSLHSAPSPEDPVVACASKGWGAFPTPGGRVARTCAELDPGDSGAALRRPAPHEARPVAPAAPPVVWPGRKSAVALAAARGPARAAASRRRRRRSAGTPPSAPAWSSRPGHGSPGVAVRPPRLQVRATFTGCWAWAASVARAWDHTPDPHNF